MSHYRTCPRCGAYLDPGEVCDCLDTEAQVLIDHVTEKKTPAGAANTDEGMVEQSLTYAVSTSMITQN